MPRIQLYGYGIPLEQSRKQQTNVGNEMILEKRRDKYFDERSFPLSLAGIHVPRYST